MHDFESILVDGIRAAGAGNRLLARMHVTNAVRQNPAHPACWLWLCATDESIDSAILSLERTLHLDPNHELAKVGCNGIPACANSCVNNARIFSTG